MGDYILDRLGQGEAYLVVEGFFQGSLRSPHAQSLVGLCSHLKKESVDRHNR